MVYPYLNILSYSECLEIIKNTKPFLQPQQIQEKQGKVLSSDRIAEGSFIYSNPPIIQKIKKIVSNITNLPIENQEAPNVVRYKPGGHYKPHHDYFDPQDYPDIVQKGNRKYSCLFYLNEGFKGGETYFPKYKLKIGPTLGTLIKWENLYSNGNINPNSLHAGLPVIEGEKWILVIWVNENKIK